jgi:hypothetical protein
MSARQPGTNEAQMDESSLKSRFAAQRTQVEVDVELVRQRQADAAQQQASWPLLQQQLTEEVLPMLARHTGAVKAAPRDVSLGDLTRHRRRLARLERSLWRHPQLVRVRLRNAGLWLVAYRREVAAVVFGLLTVALAVAGAYLVVVYHAEITALIDVLVRELQLLVPAPP